MIDGSRMEYCGEEFGEDLVFLFLLLAVAVCFIY